MKSEKDKEECSEKNVFFGGFLTIWGAVFTSIPFDELGAGVIHCSDHGMSYWDISSSQNPFFYWVLVTLHLCMAFGALTLGLYHIFVFGKKRTSPKRK